MIIKETANNNYDFCLFDFVTTVPSDMYNWRRHKRYYEREVCMQEQVQSAKCKRVSLWLLSIIDHHHRSEYSTCRRRSTDDIIRRWRRGRTEQLLDNKIPQRAVVGRHVVTVVDVYHVGFVANNILLLSREMIVFAYRADRMFNLPHRGLSRQAMYG